MDNVSVWMYKCMTELWLSMTVLDSHTLTLSMWVKRSVPKCSLLQENPAPTQQDIEDNFDGNLCRCTGYRAILDSMKTFGVDSNAQDGGVIDIEVCDESRLFTPYILSSFFFFTHCFFRHLTVGSISLQDTGETPIVPSENCKGFKTSVNVCPDNIFWTILSFCGQTWYGDAIIINRSCRARKNWLLSQMSRFTVRGFI